jgi:hypothetical protein
MQRRRLILGLALYVFATAAAAPVAFWAGQLNAAASQTSSPHLPGPGARRPSESVEMTDAVWDCEQFGDFAGLRTFDRVRPCGPRYAVPDLRPHPGLVGARARRPGPFDLATARAISDFAGPPGLSTGGASPADPFSVALSQIAGGIPATAALPEPGPTVIPVPGAALFLVSGLAALWAARRGSASRRG